MCAEDFGGSPTFPIINSKFLSVLNFDVFDIFV